MVHYQQEILLKRPKGTAFEGTPYASITVNNEDKFVFIDWQGFVTVDLVKAGSEELLKILKQESFQKILVNNQSLQGPWHKANEWYENDWNPRAIQAGMTHMAVIVSPNIFTQLSLKGYEEISKGFVLHSFDTEIEAIDWLKNQ